ncbi:c-type cytochrome [Pseudomonas mandelii]|uniref:c-type cytochrome n=1 Tax=Pseudomonas mandelii TaxID=75612 RepID=UPI00209F35F3|nr:c-type cytochrome [Pseudomonas mandelii]MCO8312927.1 c-type cytochrome [Pseudomonas mandelii]
MKRSIVIGAIVAATALAGSATIYGPELLAGYRFMNAVDQHDAEYQANGGAWPQLQDTCALCHGARGQPRDAQYAALAGQSASYIESQLHAFAEGRRYSAQMSPLAANLTDEQIKHLANYFAEQKPGVTQVTMKDDSLQQHGQRTVAANGCAACHGEKLSGGPLAPRLAGLGQLYLTDQLTAFKHGQRKDPTQAMNALAGSLSDEDIKAMAHYLANLTPSAISGGQ